MTEPISKQGIAIARVSTKEQAEGYSIDAQKKPIIEYCKRQKIQIVQFFEFSESAKRGERKNFQAAINFLLKNELKILCIEKTDRLYRNFRDYTMIEDLVEKHGVAIHLVKEGEVFDSNSNSHAKMIHGFKVLMAKSYLDNLSEEVKKGQGEKADRGYIPTNSPFGYKNNKETHLVEKDHKAAKTVKKIFTMYASGRYSLADIAMCLNDYGLRNNNERSFHSSMIHRVLSNPIHYGDFKFRGKVRKGKHEPIVSYELWQECNERLKNKNTNPTRNKKSYALAGMLYNEFGRVYSAEAHKGYTYYSARTPNRTKRVYVREDIVMGQIAQIIQTNSWSAIFAEVVQAEAQAILKEEKEFLTANIDQIRTKLDELRVQKERLLDVYITQGIDRKDFLAKRYQVERKLSLQEELLATHQKGDTDFEMKVANLVDVFLYLPERFRKANMKGKAKLLKKLVSNITVNSQKQIDVEFFEPYNTFITPEIEAINKVDTWDDALSHPKVRAIRGKLRTLLVA